MRQILLFAAAVLMAGGYFARYADHAVVHPSAQTAAVELVNEPRQPVTSGRSLILESDRHGHFKTEARIDGRYVDFLVDTGASLVILRESDAGQAGIRPRPSDYTATVSTANGKIKAAPAKLDRIELGGITVYDVPALVLPDESWGRTCSASRSCRGSSATNTPTAAWCLSSRDPPPGSIFLAYGALCGSPALGY